MGSIILKEQHIIDSDTRSLISNRYKRITRAVNRTFWSSESDTAHSFYVGSYGRGTAIDTSDLDVLVELPNSEYNHFVNIYGNGPSRLLQAVKNAILMTYPTTDIRGDGQVVVVKFSDNMRFEILPAFAIRSLGGITIYKYPDSHMGGNWMTTDPKAEQDAMKAKNGYSLTNGLLFDTCKHIRFVRDTSFSSDHLSGILIDSFCYNAIGGGHFTRDNESRTDSTISYEQALLDFYIALTDYSGRCTVNLQAPGSNQIISTHDWAILGKVLRAIA